MKNQTTPPSVRRGGIGLGPVEKAIGLDARPNVGPRDCQLLLEIQGGGELLDRCLARLDLAGIRRCRQPPGQHGLARPRPSQRQQFEQRAAAEQVEVVCIHMAVVSEALSGLTGACPAILQSCHASLVEFDAPARHFPSAERPHVAVSQPEEGGERREQQPKGDQGIPGQRGKQRTCGERGQRESRVGGCQRVPGGAPIPQARRVLLHGRWKHGSLWRSSDPGRLRSKTTLQTSDSEKL